MPDRTETLQEHLRKRLAEIMQLPPEERAPALEEFLDELRQLEREMMEEADEEEVQAIQEQLKAAQDLRRFDEETTISQLREQLKKAPDAESKLEIITQAEARELPPITNEQLSYWTIEKLHGAASNLYETQKQQGALNEEQHRQVDYIARIHQYKTISIETGDYRPDPHGAHHMHVTETILGRLSGKEQKKYLTD